MVWKLRTVFSSFVLVYMCETVRDNGIHMKTNLNFKKHDPKQERSLGQTSIPDCNAACLYFCLNLTQQMLLKLLCFFFCLFFPK